MTDANVVLGRLSPERFLGGEMRLDRNAAAEKALREKLAQPLSVSLERAAAGMLQVATAAMANAVRHVTLERGLDPRDFTLVAYGGGGPLHAASVAKEIVDWHNHHSQRAGPFLRSRHVDGRSAPRLRSDAVRAHGRPGDVSSWRINSRSSRPKAASALEASGISADRIVFERAADMRYVGQEHAVAVRMPADVGDESARAEIKRLFDDAHELRYSHSAPEESADIVSLRVSAIGRLEKPQVPEIPQGEAEPPAALGAACAR